MSDPAIPVEVDIDIFPNPVRGKLGVRSSEFADEEVRIELMDATGKRTGTLFEGALNKDQLSFETSGYDPGMYILRVSSNKKTAVKKIIIQ